MGTPKTPKKKIPRIAPAGGTASVDAARVSGLSQLGRFLRLFGPGVITGASDDDPSGIATYAVAGASQGFRTLWMALLTLPMMAAVQFMCAKIGMVTGRGLGGVLKQHYSRPVLYAAVFALVAANVLNAGADIGAIAAGFNLLLPVSPRLLIIPISLVIVVLQVWGSYRLIANIFKWLSLVLCTYILSAFFAKPALGEVLRGSLLPSFAWNRDFLTLTVGILGTTISPYLFFWQSNQEVEEEIAAGRTTVAARKGATKAELRYAGIDVTIGMFLSNLVMYFIILSTAATLFKAGKTDIQTAADAAMALRPIAGRAAEVLLAVGLIGTGFLAVPILTGSSAYAVSEALGWKHGLDRRPQNAKSFYGLIAVSTFVGMAINFTSISAVKALYLSAVINGLLAPPLLVLILRICNDPRIMGKRVNGRLLNWGGWATALVMTLAALFLLISFFL
ncbi:MAG TPA: divalent metal cation transporter [Terracidiphilus sp.]|jgi:NRAMP (natural resistance-associated macrophage protein)-like metal ion transporter